MLLQPSWRLVRDAQSAKLGVLNEALVSACAYYPRLAAFGKSSPCKTCSIGKPNKDCIHAYFRTTNVKETKYKLTDLIKRLSKANRARLLKILTQEEKWKQGNGK